MTLAEALLKIGEADKINSFPEEWRDSQFTSWHADPSFDSETIRESASFCGFNDDEVAQLVATASKAASDEALGIVIKSLFRAVFTGDKNRMRWPYVTFTAHLGNDDGAATIIAALGMVPLVREMHERNNVDEKITRDTCRQIKDYSNTFVTGRGRVGIYPNQFGWLRNYIIDSLLYLRFSRFEFMTKSDYLPARVYCHKVTREKVVFVGEELNFDKSGFALEWGDATPETAFRSSFEIKDNIACGNTVDPEGRTSEETMSINLAEYDLVLGPDMPVLDMHIPAGGGMTPEIADKSFSDAKKFYMSLPDESRRPYGAICHSWIFNPNLPEILPESSNLNKLLKKVHLLPRPCPATDGLWFIFLTDGAFDIKTARRDTSLQKSVLEYIESGKRWRTGGMFILMDDIQPYD